MFTIGRSLACRASPRAGLWSGRVSCPERGAALALLRRSGTHASIVWPWAPDQQRIADALRSIRGTMCSAGTIAASGTLFRLRFLLHIGTQHGVDAALIAFAFALEIVEHVFIDTDGDRLFPRGYHQNGVRPVDIDRHRIGIVCNRIGDVLVRQGVDASPVSLAFPAVAPLSRYDILFLHFSSRGAPR